MSDLTNTSGSAKQTIEIVAFLDNDYQIYITMQRGA
jgi:hypothetical protein